MERGGGGKQVPVRVFMFSSVSPATLNNDSYMPLLLRILGGKFPKGLCESGLGVALRM
uniref:Uncharacterized protein n=1 Tax=Anguilla anguilla TaxID=7936 RepID=A0A0E9WAW2_ANGAN